ncbi:MAG: hypothetical protein J4N69_02375 [Chloroflexi bacterium]|nr:hypothetical protein [Chloroflexota bacterium]MCI0787941.1 hypothetical protein [Chloroflexota bacterium]MCI0801578.1 hypothetical protein [Chloroflexota bacterium]MCI0829959.1 hypothetical protein [Chloroflexota bacterium]MCI0863063.1 hypothetical protein [Chloroflexota bacterium]
MVEHQNQYQKASNRVFPAVERYDDFSWIASNPRLIEVNEVVDIHEHTHPYGDASRQFRPCGSPDGGPYCGRDNGVSNWSHLQNNTGASDL